MKLPGQADNIIFIPLPLHHSPGLGLRVLSKLWVGMMVWSIPRPWLGQAVEFYPGDVLAYNLIATQQPIRTIRQAYAWQQVRQ